MVRFIRRLREHLIKREPVWIKMKQVKTIAYDGLVVLISALVRFKADRVRFNGDFPSNEAANAVLHESGFFEALELTFYRRNRYRVTKDQGIWTHASTTVDAELSARLLSKASKTIWQTARRLQGAQRVFVELMHNTHAHASPLKPGERHWWISVYHDFSKKKVRVSFVDYGVGIFESLQNKPQGSKFFGALSRLRDMVAHGDNSVLLSKILNGDLHRTATGLPFRGKGLPGIKEAMDRKQISRLHLITNDVKADVSKGLYHTLSENFSGTFLYWEIDANAPSCVDDSPDHQGSESL